MAAFLLAACQTTQVTDDGCYPGQRDWADYRDRLLARPGMTFVEIENREAFMAAFNAIPEPSDFRPTERIGYFDAPGARSVHVVWFNGGCLVGSITLARAALPEFFRGVRWKA